MVDFGHNRSELMALARGKADYLLLMDADWVIDATRDHLANLTADAYTVRFGTGIDFWRETLVRGSLDWRYVGRVHEYIHSDAAKTTERLSGPSVRTTVIGGEAKNRWENDIRVLGADLERDPDDARSAFYLGQTYRDLGNLSGEEAPLRSALHWYRRRAEMPGWAEETYCAWHQAGSLCDRLGDWPAAMDAYLRAWQVRPERLEALHALVVGLRQRDLHRSAHQFTSLASGLAPLPVPRDLLFVEPWIYRWGPLFEYSITAYWCGQHEATIAACRRLLELGELPDDHRKQTISNMHYAVRAQVRQAAAAPPVTRRIMAAGTPTRGLRSADALTPTELRVSGLARRLAAVCAMGVQEVDRRLMGLGRPVDVTAKELASWPLRVRPGTTDVAQLDTVANSPRHLPPTPLEEPGLIIDLGASIGITTLDLARRYPTAHLIAVELDAASLALCEHNLEPLADRVTLVGAAISATDGSVNYTTVGDPAHHAVAADGEAHASAITLDTLLEYTARGLIVDYLAMDIEGSERDVLRAAGRWPAQVRTIAVAPHAGYGLDDALADLRRLGFEIGAERDGSGRAYGTRDEPRAFRGGRRSALAPARG